MDQQSQGRGLPDPITLMHDVLKHRGWDIRSGQEDMVSATATGIEHEASYTGVSVNAPVGTGKTLGYLLGSLPSNRRILVCTSTKALQDQIANEELPNLAKDLEEIYGYKLRYGVLKGKGNYICLKKAEDFIGGGVGEDEDPVFAEIAKSVEPEHKAIVVEMINRTKEAMENLDVTNLDVGDLLDQVPGDVRSSISSSTGCSFCKTKWWYLEDEDEDGTFEYAFADNSQPKRHPTPLEDIIADSQCAYRTAYALAMSSDIAVINTSLLAAEMMKSRMVWELSPQLIPGAGVVVIDEAHHLTRIITEALSGHLDFAGFDREASNIVKKIARKVPQWEIELDAIPTIIRRAEDEFYKVFSLSTRDKKRKHMVDILNRTTSEIRQITESLSMNRVQPEDIKIVSKHLSNLGSEVLEPMIIALGQMFNKVEFTDKHGETHSDFTYDITLDGGLDDDGDRPSDARMNVGLVPVDISFFFSELMNNATEPNLYVNASKTSNLYDGKAMLLMCSGTITEEDTTRIGMKRDYHIEVESPFDHLRARFCVPGDLPAPNNYNARGAWFTAAWNAARQAIEAVGGRTLFLTTSFATIYGDDFNDGFLSMAEECFGGKYTILHQKNGMSRNELIQAKKEDPTSILFATTSFWEGIDIPGEALMLTIMDKFMFPQQNDPAIEAAREYFERRGDNPFMKVDVNMVAKMMAQGDGRTQRKELDLGGTLLLDSRQVSARYGDATTGLIHGAKPYTTNIDAFCDWLEWCQNNIGATEVPTPDPDYWRGLRRKMVTPRRSRRKRS